ncbi:hypothetical protein H105_00881 [Trichophyton soudanense CBS 452.61]|uniref:Uncharacterized protein n=1 Tax=Trichophyton soudanense CBS 452.61 TaxID=1215331 RepID=A0A022Y524_TRISD|nr:hypothetical protein H102_00875 [Trichophyton rubrum CBS 100081]EZF78025.1 hypothetical protein H105_00881 [Trichophyton soudanense CBS 452.61]EZG21084.1 hypothetical protein H107_00933 [Trichophyton rubrum CBS 202.88]
MVNREVERTSTTAVKFTAIIYALLLHASNKDILLGTSGRNSPHVATPWSQRLHAHITHLER